MIEVTLKVRIWGEAEQSYLRWLNNHSQGTPEKEMVEGTQSDLQNFFYEQTDLKNAYSNKEFSVELVEGK